MSERYEREFDVTEAEPRPRLEEGKPGEYAKELCQRLQVEIDRAIQSFADAQVSSKALETRLIRALRGYVRQYPAFRIRPVGAPVSPARIEQEALADAEDEAMACLRNAPALAWLEAREKKAAAAALEEFAALIAEDRRPGEEQLVFMLRGRAATERAEAAALLAGKEGN